MIVCMVKWMLVFFVLRGRRGEIKRSLSRYSSLLLNSYFIRYSKKDIIIISIGKIVYNYNLLIYTNI